MAILLKEALNANAMSLTIFCGGQNYVGINLTGTWVGTVAFQATYDGATFVSVGATPFATGTAVTSSTANGSWFLQVEGAIAVRAVFTRTSGTAIVTLASSLDNSYQDAFLTTVQKNVSRAVGGGLVNQLIFPAQENRAWRCRTLVVSFSVAPAAGTKVTLSDGACQVLWEVFAAAAVGYQTIALPLDSNTPGVSGGGVVGTPGNTFVITVSAPGGSVASIINAEMVPV